MAISKIIGSGLGTINSPVEFTTADNNPQITLVSTSTNASQGPVLDLFRNSSSPADNDLGGAIKFNAENDAGEKTEYQIIQAYMPDVSNGSEDGAFQHYVIKDGTSIQRLEHSPTETVFNQDSADVNFRVESNNQDHLFFIDGGHDGIGIGNSTIIDWSTNYPGLQMGQAGALYGHKSSNQMNFAMNWGVTTGNVFIANGIASRMIMDTTKIAFDSSASGSAAGAITAIPLFNMTPTAGSVFNSDRGGALDFRVASGSDNHALFVDASADHIMLRCSSTPDADTTGFMMTTDQLYLSSGSSTNANALVRFNNGNGLVGTISTESSATAFNTSSDYRLKENVDYTWDATTRLKQLKPARFNWIADSDNTVQDGFLAHEVSDIVPNAVTGTKDATIQKNGDGYQSIDHSKLVPLLVKTIQELEARIAVLEG